MVEAQFRDEDLAVRLMMFPEHQRCSHILEPADIDVIGNAIGIISVDRDRRASAVGDGGDAALPVGKQMAAVGAIYCTAVIPDQGLIDAIAVYVAVQHCAGRVIFTDQVIAII